jgi:chromosome segregation protein
MAGYAAGTRAVLRAAQTGQLPGVRGAVAELFRVPPELERAIEAVLGAELGAVVVDDWPTARAAARLLATGAGRTTLLPLTELQSRALDLKRLTGEPGQATVTADGDPNLAVQLASAVVEADSAIRPAVEFLLNRTVLAPNRNIARQLAAVLPPGARAVSPDGDVWLAGSGLITGSLGGEAASGPGALAREREWRELPEHIQRATAEHERQASQVAEVEHHIRNQRTTLTQIERLLSKVENERRTLRSQREAASRAVERQAQQVEWSRNRLAEIEREQAEVDQRAAEFTEQLVTLRQELEAAEASTRKIEMALAELSLAELQARVTAAQQTAALVAQAQRTQRETVEARQREVAASDNQIAARSQRLHELETEVARLAHSLESARARETELAVRVAALEAEIRPTEARLAELDGARSSADETARKLRARLQTVEQSAAQAQLESSRRQAEVDDLRRRIQDELGPVELPAQEGQISQPLLPFEPGVSRLPVIQELPKGLEDTLQKLRGQLKRIGPVNPEAAGEYTEAEERFRFLSDQVSDLETASAGLQSVIAELDRLTERDFQRTFEAVAAEFKRLFTRLFGGGQARLVLTDPEHLTTSGVDIIARIPGRRPQPLALLSGGERTLTAAALIFSILRVAPTPFCVLDEVDAMLDEANVGRFRELLEELSARTQFIVITHNRGTVEAAHTIYGISMRSDGASQVLSLRLEDVEEIRSPNGKAEIDS